MMPPKSHRIAVRTPKPPPVYLSPLQRRVLSAVQSRHSEREIANGLRVSARELDDQMTLLRDLGLIVFTCADAEDRPTLPELPWSAAADAIGRRGARRPR